MIDGPGVAALATFALLGVGLGATLLAFRAADLLVEAVSRAGQQLRLLVAPLCVDCRGRGWRRWRDGDGAPVKGWTDCRLCRGLGRIVDEGF